MRFWVCFPIITAEDDDEEGIEDASCSVEVCVLIGGSADGDDDELLLLLANFDSIEVMTVPPLPLFPHFNVVGDDDDADVVFTGLKVSSVPGDGLLTVDTHFSASASPTWPC